jgi:hypothetical protein
MPRRSEPIRRLATGSPTIAVTMGDPGGIGPEIVVQSLRRRPPDARFIVHGSGSAMHAAAETLGIEPYWWSRRPRVGACSPRRWSHRVLLIDSDADCASRGIAGRATRSGSSAARTS